MNNNQINLNNSNLTYESAHKDYKNYNENNVNNLNNTQTQIFNYNYSGQSQNNKYIDNPNWHNSYGSNPSAQNPIYQSDFISPSVVRGNKSNHNITKQNIISEFISEECGEFDEGQEEDVSNLIRYKSDRK
jgi:hypothetical protein